MGLRHGGLMVSGLDPRLTSLGLGPNWGTVLCSWAKHLTLVVLLFTQVYKWVTGEFNAGGGGVTL